MMKNVEDLKFNFTKEDSFTNSDVMSYLEDMIELNMQTDYEYEAYKDIKEYGKVNCKALKQIKQNMWKLHNEKF